MKLNLLLSFLFVSIFSLNGVFSQTNASIPPEIENPELLGINKEPYHATLMPYANLQEALAANRHASSLCRSLNGLWKFNWVPSPEQRLADFSFLRNGKAITVKGFSVTGNQIVFTLNDCVHHGDTLLLTYTPGNVKAADNGPLDAFSNLTVENSVAEPVWLSIPNKIEAENFTFKSGMQTETTGDTGGGLNLGYIGNGDWLEYAIENTSDSTDFQISFRVAAPGAGGVIDYYIDGIKEGTINVTATGNWQVYKSIDGKINIGAGKHYLKVVAKVAGFNLNYFDIRENGSGIGDQIKIEMQVYPNPATNQIFISSPGFAHNHVEILDITGRTILNKATNNEDILQIQIGAIPGVYVVRLSNSTQFINKRILVIKN